jgi:hypothetical protein
MKLINKTVLAAGWAGVLLIFSLVTIVLFQKPRSVFEFYAYLFQIDSFYLLLAVIGSFILAVVITALGQQEG